MIISLVQIKSKGFNIIALSKYFESEFYKRTQNIVKPYFIILLLDYIHTV